MNIDYISGFFDADGSISLIRCKANENKTIQISFHNTKLIILEKIAYFLYNEYSIKGHISKKPAKKENHSISYDLKYKGSNSRALSIILKSYHPKKFID